MTADANLRASIRLSLDALEAVRGSFTGRALAGEFAWWLGSGISLGAVPGTGEMVRLSLERLRELYMETGRDEYRLGFEAVLDVVDRSDITLDMELGEWRDVDLLESELARRYSAVFETLQPHIRAVANLVLDVIRVPETYGTDANQPDAEHRFLAALIAEGIVTDIVTTNWDALIETACEQEDGSCSVRAVAHPDELDGVRPRIVKIHGCARQALADPGRYGPLIVVTGEQVDSWSEDAPPFRDAVRTLLRERPLLFLGCSCRDNDIRQVVMLARERTEPFPVDVPRAVFCGDELTEAYASVLSRLHGSSFAGEDATRLRQQALVTLEAKQLLGSLWLSCIVAKARTLLDMANASLPEGWTGLLEAEAQQHLASLGERLEGLPEEVQWRAVAEDLLPALSRIAAGYSLRRVPAGRQYVALTSSNLLELDTPLARQAALHAPLVGLLALSAASREEGWSLEAPAGPLSYGQLRLNTGSAGVRVFVLQHSVYDYLSLVESGELDEEDMGDCLMIYAQGPVVDGRREDVIGTGMPSRRRIESPGTLCVDAELLVPGLDPDSGVRLILERVPVGG